MRRFSTSVTITDPLVKYQSLVASGIFSPDPAQHRLARHLQKIYLRLKDYSPPVEYASELRRLARAATQNIIPKEPDQVLAVKSHPIWRNPLFSGLLNTEDKDSLKLIRVLSDHQAAIEINSPKGLFLSGEVGTGKSMLLDLLSQGLPTEKKKRWHFNTFMLYVFSQLESHRRAQSNNSGASHEYSLLWMAKKLVDESPILFLDEFQLPDRAASRLLSNLFLPFFQLGGVLVASSNRMPEELQRATGVEYTSSPFGTAIARLLGRSKSPPRGELYGQTSDFAVFLQVLEARCDFWQMDSSKDWRRRESDEFTTEAMELLSESYQPFNVVDVVVPQHVVKQSAAKEPSVVKYPSKYFLTSEGDTPWEQLVHNSVASTDSTPIAWNSSILVVYGRSVAIPQNRNGVVYWLFDDLVASFGPADYLSMASNFHTFIIDGVPILSLSMKNEARRFITLLDALYEARCKLILRAETGPDGLFFPETRGVLANKPQTLNDSQVVDMDATYSETIAEVHQESASPFRPNISYYDTDTQTARYDPDQDSDFKLERTKKLDFGNTSAFTGEDERFAYKRATSRLWELCSAQWHARSGDWWQPLPPDARHWEMSPPSNKPLTSANLIEPTRTEITMGPTIELDEPAGLVRHAVNSIKERNK
jgi:peroxisome-assembly ATPase